MPDVIAESRMDGTLTAEQVRQVVAAAAQRIAPAGKRLLVIVPDRTRTCPLGQVARELHAALRPQAAALDWLVALGTHPPLDEAGLDALFACRPGERAAALPGCRFFNHNWKDPSALATIGRFSRDEIAAVMAPEHRLFARDIDVTVNRLVLDYDLVLVCGPVFPHEVVGFSGGAKYFFPGVCGEDLLNFFHWLGALITCPRIIGTKHTPVREVLHRAAGMIPTPTAALCMVVAAHDLAGLFFGDVKAAWSAAADLSDKLHITYVDRPFQSVLSRAPEMYDELWVAAKCMYKLEPVVADGGELIIFAPHVRGIAVAHGAVIEAIGYHCLPYFVSRWERFRHHPWGVLAHSTHVRGIGTYDGGVERPRIRVTLATGIPESLCRRVNLGYRDPASIDPADWQGRTDRLYVPRAGEMLYRLKDPPPWQRAG